MSEYTYKGFKISYKIHSIDNEKFKADGTVTYLLKKARNSLPVQFHTEYDSYSGAEHEIKKLLENYVNFELKSYYSMEKEKN